MCINYNGVVCIIGLSSIQVPGPPFFIFGRGKGGPGTWIEVEPYYQYWCYHALVTDAALRGDSTMKILGVEYRFVKMK